MLAIFRREQTAPAAAPTRRMSLDERMAWRREVLCRCVREQLMALEVLSGMYKSRAMPLDTRHHRFALMVDVTRDFRAQRAGEPLGFHAIEAALRQRCLQRHGLSVDAVYWRVHEQVAPFERGIRAADACPAGLDLQRAVAASSETALQWSAAGQRFSRSSDMPVAEEDQRVFEAAVREGQHPPPLRVGNRSYQSDLAPLESQPLVAGHHEGGG